MCKSKGIRGCLKVSLIVISVVLLAVIILGLVIPAAKYAKKVDVKVFDDISNKHINYLERTFISAHRAGGDLAPEETLQAFKLCMEAEDYSVDIVEFDLHITKDEQLVLLHDDTVNRTSNATEVCGDKKVTAKSLTLAELKQLNFGENFTNPDGETPYKGLKGDEIPDDVKILSLNEILDYLTDIRPNLQYVIEIKDDGDDGAKAMDILYDTLVNYHLIDQTIVGTFNKSVTEYIDKTYPDITRSASILEVLDFYVSYLFGVNKTFKFNVLQIPTGLFIWDFGTADIINYAHEKGIACQYWTINDPKEAKRLADNGADCIMTDNPKAIYDVLNDK